MQTKLGGWLQCPFCGALDAMNAFAANIVDTPATRHTSTAPRRCTLQSDSHSLTLVARACPTPRTCLASLVAALLLGGCLSSLIPFGWAAVTGWIRHDEATPRTTGSVIGSIAITGISMAAIVVAFPIVRSLLFGVVGRLHIQLGGPSPIDHARGWIRSGIGPFSRRWSFDLDAIRSISAGPWNEDWGETPAALRVEVQQRLGVGAFLSDEQLHWITCQLLAWVAQRRVTRASDAARSITRASSVGACSLCSTPLSPDDVSLANETAFCQHCQLAAPIAELVERNLVQRGLEDRSSGCQCSVSNSEIQLTVSTVRSIAPLARPAMLGVGLLFSGLGSLVAVAGLMELARRVTGMSAADGSPFIALLPILFGAVFLTFGLVPLGYALLGYAGTLDIRISAQAGVRVRLGVGPIGWQWHRPLGAIEEVRTRTEWTRSRGGQRRPCRSIQLAGPRPLEFGTTLSAERYRWTVAALREAIRTLRRPSIKGS